MDHVRARTNLPERAVLHSTESKIVGNWEIINSNQALSSVACKFSSTQCFIFYTGQNKKERERKSHLKCMLFECEKFFVLITEES